MRKFLVFMVAAFVSAAFGGAFEDNLAKSVKENFNENLTIVSMDELKSFKGLKLGILKNSEGKAMPLYISEDGKSFLAVSQFFHFSQSADKELFAKRINEIQELNKLSDAKKFDALFDSLPKEAFVLLRSPAKTNDLLTIVTDPDCPYCRMELGKLKEHLKTTNVRLIIAPVHDENAYIKGALIMEETKNLSPEQSDKIIAVFEKYYQDIKLDDKAKKTDTKAIHENANKIFSSGLIRGVPYLHNSQLK